MAEFPINYEERKLAFLNALSRIDADAAGAGERREAIYEEFSDVRAVLTAEKAEREGVAAATPEAIGAGVVEGPSPEIPDDWRALDWKARIKLASEHAATPFAGVDEADAYLETVAPKTETKPAGEGEATSEADTETAGEGEAETTPPETEHAATAELESAEPAAADKGVGEAENAG